MYNINGIRKSAYIPAWYLRAVVLNPFEVMENTFDYMKNLQNAKMTQKTNKNVPRRNKYILENILIKYLEIYTLKYIIKFLQNHDNNKKKNWLRTSALESKQSWCQRCICEWAIESAWHVQSLPVGKVVEERATITESSADGGTTENTNGFSVVSGANNVNEPPILEPGGYPAGLPLSESTKVGTEVFVLKGHDPEGSPVKYGIQLTDHFVVNPRTGVITLAKPLNREVSRTLFSFFLVSFPLRRKLSSLFFRQQTVDNVATEACELTNYLKRSFSTINHNYNYKSALDVVLESKSQ